MSKKKAILRPSPVLIKPQANKNVALTPRSLLLGASSEGREIPFEIFQQLIGGLVKTIGTLGKME